MIFCRFHQKGPLERKTSTDRSRSKHRGTRLVLTTNPIRVLQTEPLPKLLLHRNCNASEIPGSLTHKGKPTNAITDKTHWVRTHPTKETNRPVEHLQRIGRHTRVELTRGIYPHPNKGHNPKRANLVVKAYP